MSDFTVRSDNVDVEQIMRQIRARIREKRGVDYTEEEIRELANVKLEKFIDPKGVRSNLLEEYRQLNSGEGSPPNFAFGEDTLFETHRAPIRWLRALLRPFLKLLFNPNPLIKALNIQSELNARRPRIDALNYEVIHNLVVELTRTGVEVKSLTMRLESMASRLDFDERRARALEGVVQYRAGAVPPLQPPTGQDQGRRDQGRRDQGQRQQGSRDQGGRHQGQRTQGQGPRDQGPRDQGPRDQGSRDQSPRDQGSRDQSARDQASRDQASRDQTSRDQASRDQASRDQTSRDQASRDQASRDQASRDQAPREQIATDQAPRDQGPREQAPPREAGASTDATSPAPFQGNALDADGNERRARRRRRRGRRRPGDRPAFAEGSGTSTGETVPGGDEDRDADAAEPRSDVALEGTTAQAATAGIEDTPASPHPAPAAPAHESGEAPARPAPAPEPPSES
jgi:hypothetical protein